jgi:hypothetical protein
VLLELAEELRDVVRLDVLLKALAVAEDPKMLVLSIVMASVAGV